MDILVPLGGWGFGHRAQSLGLYCLVCSGGGSGAGLNGDCGRGVRRPWVGLASGDGDVDEGFDTVVLGGRLCGGGGRWWEGGVGCGGWGVLVRVGVWVRALSLG